GRVRAEIEGPVAGRHPRESYDLGGRARRSGTDRRDQCRRAEQVQRREGPPRRASGGPGQRPRHHGCQAGRGEREEGAHGSFLRRSGTGWQARCARGRGEFINRLRRQSRGVPGDLRERRRRAISIPGMNPSDTGDDTESDPPTDVLPVSEPATRRPGPGLARRLVGLALIVLPLVLAALWAVVGPAPQPEEAGPTTGGPLRSALSDASANSSFTAAATGRLREGSAELADGAEEMRTGGQQLATGMDQLQA